MSISVTQEEAKFRPVTIVIDDVRTANLLRFAVDTFIGNNVSTDEIAGYINAINDHRDAHFSLDELKALNQELFTICKY